MNLIPYEPLPPCGKIPVTDVGGPSFTQHNDNGNANDATNDFDLSSWSIREWRLNMNNDKPNLLNLLV